VVHGRTLAVALLGLALLASPARAADGAAQGVGAPQLTDTSCADKTFPDCKRIRYAFGPVTVGPGSNTQLFEPNIGKPAYDGYVLRLSANLYRPDGSVPPVDVVHLHHGVWLSIPEYGNFPPFFATGEEKTALRIPSGYGMAVSGSDTWALGYMLHNLTPVPEPVYIVYDIDYVAKEPADAAGIKKAVPVWLDVMLEKRPGMPTFNVQQGYGHRNAATGKRECSYPKETCAAFDPYGMTQPGNGKGWDFPVSQNYSGTLIAAGGHVHPGGLRDDLSIVRGGAERHVFSSEAKYFDKGGPLSWDMAMTVTPPDWRVRIEPGDKIRLNATYDTSYGSWYEGMGIVMAFLSPGDASGVDPFGPLASAIPTKGSITHGPLAENANHGGARMKRLTKKTGRVVSKVAIRNFLYKQGDLSLVGRQGIPRVKLGKPVVFDNFDASRDIWHTITTCALPCTASTGISYPLANSRPSIDSLELGTAPKGNFIPQAASGQRSWSFVPKASGLRAGQTVTYFCRIHPFMRGALKIIR
jgi:hypothetical protein